MLKQGYKKTEFGVIPKDWEFKRIKDIATISMCKRVFAEQTTKEGQIPFYKIGTFGKTPDAYISKKLYYEYKEKYPYPKKGDILFSASGTLGRTVVFDGKDAYFQDSNIVWLNINTSLIINPYLYQYFNVIKWASSEGSTISRLYNDIIYNTNILLPSIVEQENISATLSNMDNMISSLEKLIEKKKAIKQGAMQELLTEKRKLKGFDKSWRKYHLYELFEANKGLGLSKEILNPSGKNECILYGELFTTYNEIINKVVNKTNVNEGCLSQKYDVLMPCSTTTSGRDLATASVIMKDDVLMGGDICVLRRTKDIDTRLFGYLIPLLADEIIKYTQGITIVHLKYADMMEMEVSIPSDKAEQTAIADILEDMDKEIAELEQKLAKCRQLKQGMMEQLLTGKIRLI